MKFRVAAGLAVKETRRARGTLFFCVFSVALGVMALCSIRSVADSLRSSIQGQAREILGADIELQSNQTLDEGLGPILTKELIDRGGTAVNVTEFYSMLARSPALPGKRSTELVRVYAIGDAYPLYGSLKSTPADQFKRLGSEASVVLDPAIMRNLGIETGDRVKLGGLDALVLGSVQKSPGSPAAEFSLAPILYIHERFLGKTGLITTGSRAQYQRMFAVPSSVDQEKFKDDNWNRAIAGNITIKTSRESASNVQRFLGRLTIFLTSVGLITLLLGALGIGSAMHAFMRSRLDHAAILRCLGARPRDLLFVYTFLSLLIACIGSLIGIAVGSLVPYGLAGFIDSLGGDLLPAEVTLQASTSAAVHAFVAGVIATFAFTLGPIWRTSRVAPLMVFRRETEGLGGRPPLGVLFGVFFGVLGLAILETGSLTVGGFFTVAIFVALLAMAALSRAVMALAAAIGPRLRRYHLRQGIANLHRPGNQTRSVFVAVGMGFVLLGSILVIQTSLQQTVAIEERQELPNIFLIDLQSDQRAGADAILEKYGAKKLEVAPMISARVRAVNGKSIDKTVVQSDATQRTFADRMRTREYFLSYRDYLMPSAESITEGTFWKGRPPKQEASISENLAENLEIEIGDTLTLDIQGLPLDAIVTSFREIQWQAMRPNAMILLSPGEIEKAPTMFVAALRVPDKETRYRLQTELVATFPNLSVVDVSEAAETVISLLSRIAQVFRLLGVLAIFMGAVILAGAAFAGRHAREREAMLLKVLGASRRDLRAILVSEYMSLAVFGTLAGWLLTEALTRAALPFLFQTPAVFPYPMLLGVAAFTIVFNVTVGLLVGRRVSQTPPLEILR